MHRSAQRTHQRERASRIAALSSVLALACCTQRAQPERAPTPIDPAGLARIREREREREHEDRSLPRGGRSASDDAGELGAGRLGTLAGWSAPPALAVRPRYAAIRDSIAPLLRRSQPPTRIVTHRAWRGIGTAFDYSAVLALRRDRYVGHVRCEYHDSVGWLDVTVPLASVRESLTEAERITVTPVAYNAATQLFDDYPRRGFVLEFGRQAVALVSWSQTGDGAPWGAFDGAANPRADQSSVVGALGDSIRSVYTQLLADTGIDRCERFARCVDRVVERSPASSSAPSKARCSGFRATVSQTDGQEAYFYGREYFAR